MSYNPMRIMHIIIGLDVGGAELMLERVIASTQGSSGLEHEVISLTSLGPVGMRLRDRGVKVEPIGASGALSTILSFFKLRKIIKRKNPAVVHTWMYHSDFIGGLAAKSASASKIIWCVRSSNIRVGSRVTLLLRKVNAWLSHIVPSEIVYAANRSRVIHEEVGYVGSKGKVISNGFDTERFKPDPLVKIKIREKFGIRTCSLVFLSMGRYHSVKNHKLMIDSFVKMLTHGKRVAKDTLCILAGRGVDAENAELMSYIPCEFRDYFILIGEQSKPEEIYCAADIYCLHSHSEGFPNSLAEAMSSGLVCVSTDVGDSELILGSDYFVSKDFSVSSYSKKLDLAAEEILKGTVSVQIYNRKRIIDMYSLESMSKEFVKLYTMS